MRRHALLVGLLLALPCVALADYKETYRKGIEAVDLKQWSDVASRMREAIAENPKEGEKVKLYGLRFEVYLPYFYLGLALVNGGDCDGAVKALSVSEEQGAIRNTPKLPELMSARKACEARLAKAATPPPPTLAPPHTLPATPRPTPEPVSTPRATPAERSPEPTQAPVTPPAAKPSSVPADLLAAARAYFAGRYAESAATLARSPGPEGRAGAQWLLLRSASRYALYRIAGEQDAALRHDAAQDAAAARRADPSVAPTDRDFSPAFQAFFREAH
jgi:type IV secretory pathway VirB10-like protein